MRTPLAPLCAALVAGLLLTACGGEPFQPTHTGTVPLDGSSSAGQTFHSPSGQVRRVDLLVATYGEPADPAGTLAVDLVDAPGGSVLASARLPGEALADNTWVAVEFGGATEVGERAAIEVGWDGASPVALRANVPPAGWGGDRLLNDPYPGGELLRDGRAAAGDLAFRVAGAGGGVAVVTDIARLARGGLARLLDRPLFAVAWVLLVAGAATLVLGARRARP
jgi:hypothetical protein